MRFSIIGPQAIMRRFCHWVIILGLLFLYGCKHHATLLSAKERTAHAIILAHSVGWQAQSLHTDNYTFKVFSSRDKFHPSNTLTIYIEGDGLAWLTSEMASTNPTPLNPIGLRLAIRDKKHSSVVYLARACQYVFDSDWKQCKSDDWTNRRFSPDIVHATQQAIDKLKTQYKAKQLILIGYSGGGAIAALVAAKRTDVIRMITIAGTLDIKAWVRQNNLTPLYGSLNPADYWKSLASIPQTHWVGGKDTRVPKEVAYAYASHFPITNKPEIKIVSNYDHTCCWVTSWE